MISCCRGPRATQCQEPATAAHGARLRYLVIVIVGLVIGPYGDAHRIAVLDALGLAMVGIGFPVSVSFFLRAHRIRRQLREDEDEVLRMLSGKD